MFDTIFQKLVIYTCDRRGRYRHQME